MAEETKGGDMMGRKGDLCYGSSMDSHPVALAKENTANLIRVGQVKYMCTLSGKYTHRSPHTAYS